MTTAQLMDKILFVSIPIVAVIVLIGGLVIAVMGWRQARQDHITTGKALRRKGVQQ